MLRKTLSCAGVLLVAAALAAWLAATGRGPHVPLWLIGVAIAVVLAWLYLPPRRRGLPGPTKTATLTVLSVLSLTCFGVGLMSYATWTQIDVLNFGYSGAWPDKLEDDGWYVNIRFGQLDVGRFYGGREGAGKQLWLRYGPYLNTPAPSRWQWKLLVLSRFQLTTKGVINGVDSAFVRPDGLNVLMDRVTVPFWFPAFLFGAYPLTAFFRRVVRTRCRKRRGLCPTCGYNLTGLTVPRCPECGIAVELPGRDGLGRDDALADREGGKHV